MNSGPLTKTHQKKKVNAEKCTNANPSNVSDRQTFFLFPDYANGSNRRNGKSIFAMYKI